MSHWWTRLFAVFPLLALAVAGQVSSQLSEAQVSFHQAPPNHDSGNSGGDRIQLRLVCEASGGPPGGHSVRLFCPSLRKGPVTARTAEHLCFENCHRTAVCSDKHFCASAECTQVNVTGEMRRFQYTFHISGSAREPGNFTFECRHGSSSSSLLAAVAWRAVVATTVAETAATKPSAAPRENRATSDASSSERRVNPMTTTSGRGDSITRNRNSTDASSVSAGTLSRDRTHGLPTAIDTSTIYLVGFCAVGLLSAAVLVALVTCLIVYRGRCKERRGARGTLDPDGEKDKERLSEQAANLLGAQPMPDVLPLR